MDSHLSFYIYCALCYLNLQPPALEHRPNLKPWNIHDVNPLPYFAFYYLVTRIIKYVTTNQGMVTISQRQLRGQKRVASVPRGEIGRRGGSGGRKQPLQHFSRVELSPSSWILWIKVELGLGGKNIFWTYHLNFLIEVDPETADVIHSSICHCYFCWNSSFLINLIYLHFFFLFFPLTTNLSFFEFSNQFFLFLPWDVCRPAPQKLPLVKRIGENPLRLLVVFTS